MEYKLIFHNPKSQKKANLWIYDRGKLPQEWGLLEPEVLSLPAKGQECELSL